MQNLNTAKYTNLSQETTSVFEHSPEDHSKGKLIVLFSLKEGTGREVFERVKNNYYSNRESQSILTQLKRAFLSARDSINGEAVISILKENIIYCLCFNGSGVALKRSNSLVPLLKTAHGEYATVSGILKPGDFILMASHDVFANLSMDGIKESLKDDAQTSIENFTSQLVGVEGICIYVVNDKLENLDINVEALNKQNKTEEIAFGKKRGIKTKAVGIIDKLLSKLPSQKIVIQSEEDETKKRKKTASLIGVILTLILSVSIYFGTKASDQKKVVESYEPQLLEATHNLDEAKEIASLSPIRAQELLGTARESALDLQSRGVNDERLTKLIQDIKDNLGQIAGIFEDEPKLFIDLSIVASNFSGNNMSFASDLVRVLDIETKRLVGVDITSKRTEIIASADLLPSVLNNFSYENRSFILSRDGIREVTEDVELVIKDQEWNSEKVMAKAFAGNIYVLNKDNNQILRYPGVVGGFQDATNWIADDININFSQAEDMVIDGEIWVLNAGGVVTRLSLGVPRNFSLSGDRVGLISPTKIYTEEDSEYLYILDSGSKKILIIDKNGQYKAEYTNEKLSSAKDFVVSEQNKLIVFLSEGKLYSLDIKHIKDGDIEQES